MFINEACLYSVYMIETYLNNLKLNKNYVEVYPNFILSDSWVGPKVSALTYKSRAKWKMQRGIYSAIYGEVNISVSVCVEIKGDYIEK